MKEWRINQEYADMNFVDFPTTEWGVAQWFKSRDVDALYPQKIRRRKGRGGGVERHFNLLPESVQNELRRRDLAVTRLPDIDQPPRPNVTAPMPAPPPATEAGERRRDAKLLILSFWDGYRAQHPSALDVVRQLFIASYRSRKLANLPDWVYEALTAKSGKVQKISMNTLRNWEKQRARGDLNGLGGRYGARKGTGILDKAEDGKVAIFIAALIIKQPHLTVDHIRDLCRNKFGDIWTIGSRQMSVPALRNFQRFTAKWKIDHAEMFLKKTDPDAFKSKMRARGSNMNHWVTRPNQLWEIDASPADVLLDDGRYSLYAVVDIYTRRMLVTISKTAKTSAVLLLMRKAILAWGAPDILRTDNGSDFVSYEFQRDLLALGIEQDITAPFSPEQKGTIERHIGTLQRGCISLLPEFVGHNVADRSKIEARKSFAQRLGVSDANASWLKLTAEELQTKVDEWIEHKYSHSAHAGINGETPFARAAASIAPIRWIENLRALDMLLAPVAGKDGIRTVTASGIKVDRMAFIHPDLVPQTRVFCRHDPDDLGRLYVYSADGRDFLCVAECPEVLGVDPGDAIRAVREAQQERIANEVKPLEADIRRMKPLDLIDGVIAVNKADSASLTAFPIDKSRTAAAHNTPELDAANEALAGPADPTPLSDEDRTTAEAKFEELSTDTAEERWVQDAIAASPSGYPHMPIPEGQERPKLLTDEAMAHWLADYPKQGNSEMDFAYINKILRNSPSFRLLIFESAEMRTLECPESLKLG